MGNKLMVRCDMEGAGGIVSYAQCVPGAAEYEEGRRLFMSDLLALVEGLQAGGVEEICIYDEHYDGRNVLLDRLPDGVSVICGKPPYLRDWAGGLDGSFAGMILLGLHAKSGTPGATLAHTYEHDIRDIRLNGLSVGEIGVETAIAGDWGVPLLMIVGDSAGVAEARALFPDVAAVAVKESLGETGAHCLPAATARKRIHECARAVAEVPPRTLPWSLGADVEMEIALRDGPYLQAYRRLFPEDLADRTTVRIVGSSVTACWAEYWDHKLQALALPEAER